MEQLTGLRFARDFQVHAPIQCRHFNFATSCHKVDRDFSRGCCLHAQDSVLFHLHLNVQIACWCAVLTCFAFTCQTDAVTRIYASRDFNGQGLVFSTRPWPWHLVHGSLISVHDHDSADTPAGQRRSPDASAPDRNRDRLDRFVAAYPLSHRCHGKRHTLPASGYGSLGDTANGLFQRQLHVVAQIAPRAAR